MVAFHIAHEAVASGMLVMVHVPSEYNLADVCTEPLTGVVLDTLILPVLYDEKKTSTLLKMEWSSGD